MSARIAAVLGAVRRTGDRPVADLPSDKRWIGSRDHESALLTLAAQALDDAEDFACEAYGKRVLPMQRGQR